MQIPLPPACLRRSAIACIQLRESFAVRIRPGSSIFTVMQVAAVSFDNDLLQPTSDERMVLDIARLGMGCTTPDDATVRILTPACLPSCQRYTN